MAVTLEPDTPCTCGNDDGSRHVFDEHEKGGGRCTVDGCDCLGFESDEG